MSVTLGRLQFDVRVVVHSRNRELRAGSDGEAMARVYARNRLMDQIESERRNRLSAAMVAVGRLICPR